MTTRPEDRADNGTTRGHRAMPDTWTSEELVRGLQRVEDSLKEMRAEQRSLVPRETWDIAWLNLKEWRSMVAADVVNVQADVGHLRTEVDARFNKERAERVTAVRWGIGVSLTTIGTVVTLILSRL